MDPNRDLAQKMLAAINQVLLGKEEPVMEAFATMLAGGHVLIEDIPGVGKTTLALALSRLMGLQWRRVQFTPDVLPSDLTGFSIYRKDKEAFVYQPGAVFCNILLADEINRTSPKTQSALLETMEEGAVSVDGVTRPVPAPFFVIATQNPLSAEGTQPLPMAQMDRFMIQMSIGYPDFASEIALAKQANGEKRAEQLSAMIDASALSAMQRAVGQVYLHDTVYAYIVRLVAATRDDPYLQMGASPRGTIALVKMARAAAWLRGRDFVTPADVVDQFPLVITHRILLNGRARLEGVRKRDVLQRILKETDKPTTREA
nr:MoxR family ATPase [Maliibacterium massiliense]